MTLDQRQYDQVLVNKLLAGDLKAFDELYHRYSKRVFGFCFGLLRSREEAESIVQEVFIKIWENRNNLRPDLSFSWYLFTIARNSVINLINHRKYEQEYARQSAYVHSILDNNTEELIFYADTRSQIDSAINKLPARRREVFLLSRRDGLSYQEIADTLNLSVKTIEVQISQALKQIREELRKESALVTHCLTLISFLSFISA
jgi:RNA polymerase sigma-70 factor (family 1)